MCIFNPAVPIPENYPTDTQGHVQNDTCVRVFAAALLKIQNTGNRLNTLPWQTGEITHGNRSEAQPPQTNVAHSPGHMTMRESKMLERVRPTRETVYKNKGHACIYSYVHGFALEAGTRSW